MADPELSLSEPPRVATGEDASPVPAQHGHQPLAARMRPRSLDEYVGQSHVIGDGTALRRALAQGLLRSLILFGPPGVGKTSLARVLARHVDAVWIEVSAVSAGVKDLRRHVEEGRARYEMRQRQTVLFVDEIHRFSTTQQDALLPGVEAGWVTLIGATTENPFFEVTAPLLSRCQLLRLEPLTPTDIRQLITHALTDAERGFAGQVTLTDDAYTYLIDIADGDARAALTALDIAAIAAGFNPEGTDDTITIDVDGLTQAQRRFRYDKAQDSHYDQASAFIKSLRGSDPDAAVYWMLRMLESGEDPRFIARRMVIFASEDIGLADRGALPVATAAFDALTFVGLPEARYALTHAAIALATAPKSNSVARALYAGLNAVNKHGNAAVPDHLRDAHYKGAKALNAGVGYQYPHDHPSGFIAEQQYLPDGFGNVRLYEPSEHGHEAAVKARLDGLRASVRDAHTARRQNQTPPTAADKGELS
jgi:putative ATPase